MAKISVCIPVYNGAEYIQQTIESVLNQTFSDFELAVVDNCSTDDTVKIVKEFCDKDSRIRLVQNDKNYGLVGNFTRCVEVANSEFIQILCADDLLAPTCLEEKYGLISSDFEIAFVCSATTIIDGNGKKLMVRNALKKNGVYDGKKLLKKAFRSHNIFGEPSNVLLRKGFSLQVGEFSSECPYAVDFVYWLHLCLLGKVGYIAKPLMNFRISDIGTSGKYLKDKAKLKMDDDNFVKIISSLQGVRITKFDIFLHRLNTKLRIFAKRIFYELKK